MSLQIQAKIICDNCGAEILGKLGVRASHNKESLYDAKRTAAKNGWITVSRGRYRSQAHYCKDCADKPVAKIKDPPRRPKCRACKGTGLIMKWTTPGCGKAETCTHCNGTGKPNPESGDPA